MHPNLIVDFFDEPDEVSGAWLDDKSMKACGNRVDTFNGSTE